MKTINLEIARNKTKTLEEFFDGLAYIESDAPGMQSYFAAKGVVHAGLRTSLERKLNAARKAAKQFNVMVTLGQNERGIPTVRIYSPIKQIEIFL
jgi:hypothetical protein